MDSSPPATDVEIDTRALLSALRRAAPYIAVFLALVVVGTYGVLSRLAPVYKSETTLLLQSGESSLTRSTSDPSGGDPSVLLDEQAVTSQVQLIQSRDLARAVAANLKLADRPEFNKGGSLLGDLLVKLGLKGAEPQTSVEQRVLDAYYDKLSVYAVDKSRVIGIDFSSTDPELAATAANAVAEEYLARQRDAKRDTTSDAAAWLAGQIGDLRTKVQDAETKVEKFRTGNDLFGGATTPGSGDTTLAQQQLADLSAELTKVRTDRADAETKAPQIRSALKVGSIPNVSEVLNSALVQNLIGQAVALKSQRAQLNATLLPGHPKMQELNAQIVDLDRQIVAEANKIVDALESDAALARARETQLNGQLGELKTVAATSNDASVELRALEREAAAQRDLLDSYLRRYREALAREQTDYLPADARVISRAAVSNEPAFPKKVPMTVVATVAAMILSIAFVLLRELASGRPMREVDLGARPAGARTRERQMADLREPMVESTAEIQRMLISEPTLVPELVDRVEETLQMIAARVVDRKVQRILVTLAEGSDIEGRPLGAVALSRELARAEQRVVLLDFRGDGADAASMGGNASLPGFSELLANEASFADVIARDAKSRVHYISAGREAVRPEDFDGDQLETLLTALTLTYDVVVLDAADDAIAALAPSCGEAVVVGEFGATDPRTVRAFERVASVSEAHIDLLVVDPATPQSGNRATAPAGAAA